jgi:small GTP-binding protein
VNWFLSEPVKNDCYIPTIENFHKTIYKIRGEIFSIDILDTSGHDPYPAMKKLNIMTGDLFILVFSVDDIDSYIQMKQLLRLIFELKRSKKIPILIIGNKLDCLIDKKIPGRCVDISEMHHFFSVYKSCIYSEISCRTGTGIDSAFQKFFDMSNLPKEISPSKHK